MHVASRIFQHRIKSITLLETESIGNKILQKIHGVRILQHSFIIFNDWDI